MEQHECEGEFCEQCAPKVKFDDAMAQAIREYVRVKGGGDVQRAFGSFGTSAVPVIRASGGATIPSFGGSNG